MTIPTAPLLPLAFWGSDCDDCGNATPDSMFCDSCGSSRSTRPLWIEGPALRVVEG